MRAISFDCYGTLIDWTSGILAALAPFRDRIEGDDGAVIARYSEAERAAQEGGYRPYRAVLGDVMRALVSGCSDAEAGAIAESIKDWQAFPDTNPSLERLSEEFKLAIVSNIDDDLFEATDAKISAPLSVVVTSQQVKSYKPGRKHFDTLVQRLGLAPHEILHVAESRHHDILPASGMGFPTCWIRRPSAASASGPGENIEDALEFDKLEDLCYHLGV
ncbi:MAG: HAD-IA family hydrolase [Planctomycetota bacterium]